MIPNYCAECGDRVERGVRYCAKSACQMHERGRALRKLADRLGIGEGCSFMTKENLMRDIAGVRVTRRQLLAPTQKTALNVLEFDLKRHPFEECNPFWERFFDIVNRVQYVIPDRHFSDEPDPLEAMREGVMGRDMFKLRVPPPGVPIEDLNASALITRAVEEGKLEIRHVLIAQGKELDLCANYVNTWRGVYAADGNPETDVDLRAVVIQKLRARGLNDG